MLQSTEFADSSPTDVMAAPPPSTHSSAEQTKTEKLCSAGLITAANSCLPQTFSVDIMANKEQVSDPLMKRRSSFPILPPDMSELRVILLGNSWSERSSVANFILGLNVFTTEEEPDQCVCLGRKMKDKTVTVINTPDLLQPDISLENLRSFCDPGPHVFLLVLQPEDFTKEDNQRLQSILETFSERSWSHSVLLISTPEEEILPPLEKTFPSLRDFIKKCGKTLLWKENLQQNLLTSLRNMMKENNGEHLTPSDSRGTHSDSLSGPQSLKSEGASSNIDQTPVDGNTHGLRIVLFGKSDEKKTALRNIITGKQEFKVSMRIPGLKQHVSASGEWEGKPLTVVKTPDLFNMSLEAVRKEMKKCVELCSPGPNVLLLLVKNSEFTEEDRKTLLFILSLFGQDVFKHSMVVLTHKDEAPHSSVDQLIQDCQQKVHSFTLDKKNPSKQEIQSLMQKIENIASTNRGQFLVLDREADVAAVRREPEPPLNLVLFGRRGAGKTSAVKAILGPGRLGPPANSSQCVRSQGEVCGRWVSVVELPALHGRPQEEVMEECLSCVSLCDPEGVHAFILVLPVAPLTDEDKSELQTIQKTFSSRVNDFIMILFTVNSESPSLNVLQENKELQELYQSCRGEHFVLNINGRQELSRFIYNVETMKRDRNEAKSYTMKMLCNAHIGKISELEEKINLLQSENKNLKTKITGSCENEEENQNTDCLRIVLLGKTGSGKSSSGNTILGREEFKAAPGDKSVTKSCQKAECEVDNRKVAVVDTPGLFDNSLSNEEIQEELVKCVSLLAPGPHVFLLVVRIGRFTPEEKQTLELIREGFGKNSQHFTIILLTGGDDLDNMSDEEFIEKCSDSFKRLIANCGGRYHVFNNKKTDPSQVRQLIAKIDTMVKKNGGDCFTNEMLQEAEASIKKEMGKLLKEKEEEMEREREELKKKHEEEIQKMNARMEKQRAELEEKRKLMEEQLKEKEERIRKEREMRKREQEEREEEDRRKKSQEEVQRQEWKQKLEALEKKIKSESEQKENIVKKLEETQEEMRKKQEILEEEKKDWWEKRQKENEETREKEQTRLLKLQEEFEQEREKNENKRKEDEKKHEEEIQKMNMRMEKQRAELEEERKLMEEQLKEKEERIRKEREVRKREQEEREEEDRRKKSQEEVQRQEWKQKLEALEKKIKSESEQKETTDKKLEETREEMKKEREIWEEERKNWWHKRQKESEETRQKEETRLLKLQEEFEQEIEKYEKKRKEDDEKKREEEIQKMNVRMEKQRAELEEKRKLMEEQLKEKEERIRKEREVRKREQEEREKEDRMKKNQEEAQRQEWKQKLEALEKKIKSESEQKETTDKKLEETREEMKREREIWEEERKDWWEKRQKESEETRQKEQTRLLKLQEEFEQEREKYEKKRKEDEKKHEEEEKKREELEEKFKNDVENIEKKHKEEAQKQAEEFNEFKRKKEKEIADLIEKLKQEQSKWRCPIL